MMLSRDLRELADTFERWCTGEHYVTVEAWADFRRDLRTSVARASLLELGIGVNVLDIAVECAKPDSNVRLFPTRAQRDQQGGAA